MWFFLFYLRTRKRYLWIFLHFDLKSSRTCSLTALISWDGFVDAQIRIYYQKVPNIRKSRANPKCFMAVWSRVITNALNVHKCIYIYAVYFIRKHAFIICNLCNTLVGYLLGENTPLFSVCLSLIWGDLRNFLASNSIKWAVGQFLPLMRCLLGF